MILNIAHNTNNNECVSVELFFLPTLTSTAH